MVGAIYTLLIWLMSQPGGLGQTQDYIVPSSLKVWWLQDFPSTAFQSNQTAEITIGLQISPCFKIGCGGNRSQENCLKNPNCSQPPRKKMSFMGEMVLLLRNNNCVLDKVLNSFFGHHNHPLLVLQIRKLRANEVQ